MPCSGPRLTAALLLTTALSAGGALAAPSDPSAFCRDLSERLQAHEAGTPLRRLAQAATAQDTDAAPPDEIQLASELSDMLQACSYEGATVQIAASALRGAAEGDGKAVVAEIMRFTGLPPNFRVIEEEIDNAAAVVLLDENGIPVRLIVYGRAFINEVRNRVAQDDWAPVSILAHEIGHHLSGHTLIPGGSQPPTELEADRFSGFVLHKMGAGLEDATRVAETLLPEEDGDTHPGRRKRVAAITLGWQDSCLQAGGSDCAGERVARLDPQPAEPPQPAAAPAPEPDASQPAFGSGDSSEPVPSGGDEPARADVKPGEALPVDADLAGKTEAELEAELNALIQQLGAPGADMDAIGQRMEAITVALAASAGVTVIRAEPKLDATAPRDILPLPDPQAIPSKTNRFVWDAVGILDPETKGRIETEAYDFAAEHGLEVVTMVVDDLRGLSADEFAMAMMRQLRVGKLEVGNGAVFVVAPKARQSGLALGPGIEAEYGFGASRKQLRAYGAGFIDMIYSGADPAAPSVSDSLGEAARRVMRDAKAWEWSVRYPSIAAIDAAAEAYERELQTTGERYDPEKSPTWRKLVRAGLTLSDRTPKDDPDTARFISEAGEALNGPAMLATLADGRYALIHVSPMVEKLMPVRLEEGRRYSAVLREQSRSDDMPIFILISYDLLEEG